MRSNEFGYREIFFIEMINFLIIADLEISL